MNSPTFVVRPNFGNLGWVVRFSHDDMGEAPVGPRLAKGTRYPNEIGTHFDFKEDAESACKSWAEWYNSQPYLSKKRKAKYIA
tara:strand:- start:586 stop:834 length:249 start_codon:yes stop_codon:yes gene_type:complete